MKCNEQNQQFYTEQQEKIVQLPYIHPYLDLFNLSYVFLSQTKKVKLRCYFGQIFHSRKFCFHLWIGATLSSFLDKIHPVYSNPHRIKQQFADASTDDTIAELETTKSTNKSQLPIQQDTIYVFNETDELTSSSNQLFLSELRNFIYFIAYLILNKII